MDLTPLTTSHGTVKSPEPDSETPTRIQPIKPFPFTNGVLKRHHHHSTPPPPQPPHPVSVIYKECLKNHAASLGGHALDGCGEFMPSPTSTPTDPTSFKCAACGCHRNFHRREPEEPLSTTTTTTHVIEYQPHHRHHPPPPPLALAPANRSPSSASPPPISSSYYPSAPHMLLALSGGGLTPAMPENVAGGVVLPYSMVTPSPNSRKRFRTKFTQDQKDKMCEFAEKVGWKMQKRDEEMVKEFCSDIGIDKGVLKVWMHNNKNTLGKKDEIGIGRNNTLDEHIHNDDDDDDEDKMNNGNDGGGGGGGGGNGDGDGHAAGTNGSSSSS